MPDRVIRCVECSARHAVGIECPGSRDGRTSAAAVVMWANVVLAGLAVATWAAILARLVLIADGR
jgi:hypothetical protein